MKIIISFIGGCFVGIFYMCLLQINKINEKEVNKNVKRN